MIEIEIPKEIKEFEDKILFGLTVRQLIATVIASVITIPMYFALKDIINKEILSYIIIFLDCIILSVGWVSYNGMRMEEFIIVFIEQTFFLQKRCYSDCNIYEGINKEVAKSYKVDEQKKKSKKGSKAKIKKGVELNELY